MKLGKVSGIGFKANLDNTSIIKDNSAKLKTSIIKINLNNSPLNHLNKAITKTKIKIELNDAIKNKDYEKILNHFKIKTEKDENDILTISHFEEPEDFTFKDLGIDENEMFKKIKSIKGNADFRDSQITSLGNLKSIGGNASFYNSQITSLEKLENIGGQAAFHDSQITSLGNLKSIGGDAIFERSKITSLGNLESIGGGAYFWNSQITSLGNLESIGGGITYSPELLKNIEDELKDTISKEEYSSGDIKTIFDTLRMKYEFNEEDNSFNIKGGYYDSSLSVVGVDTNKLFKHIKKIGGDASFGSNNLRKLEYIGEIPYFGYSKIISLGKLESIGGDANFGYSQITSLGNLKNIGGDAYFQDSEITSLEKLESIEGDAIFGGEKIAPFGKLRSITKGDVFYRFRRFNPAMSYSSHLDRFYKV